MSLDSSMGSTRYCVLPIFNLCLLCSLSMVSCESKAVQKQPKKVSEHIMVHVPTQRVQVGRDPTGDGGDGSVPYDESPEHWMQVEEFYIFQTEVTNAQFATFLNESKLDPAQSIQLVGYKGNSIRPTQILYTGKRYRAALGRERHPVATVTHEGARLYCEWLNGRLPTEFEWVAAIRAGSESIYPWGEEVDANRATWAKTWSGSMPTTEVGSHLPNAYGIYDGMGNVWEWTSSFYLPFDGSSKLDDGKERRVLKGGDWYANPEEVSVYTRFVLEPTVRGLMDGGVGFRCVVEAE